MKFGLRLLLLLFASAPLLSQAPETPSSNSAIPEARSTKSPISEASPASVASNPMTAILPDLDKLEAAAKQADLDIGRLRIEKWKANSDARSAAQANADSVQRNLTAALPGLINAVRSAPEDVNAEFKLYRNLNALYDVFGSVTEATRVFGQKGDYEVLAQQLQVIGSLRRKLGEALEQLTVTQQRELEQMRLTIKAQQEQLAAAEAAAAKPKEIVVAQSEPPKKAAPKKKTAPKKPAPAGSSSNPPSSGSNSNASTAAGTTIPKP